MQADKKLNAEANDRYNANREVEDLCHQAFGSLAEILEVLYPGVNPYDSTTDPEDETYADYRKVLDDLRFIAKERAYDNDLIVPRLRRHYVEKLLEEDSTFEIQVTRRAGKIVSITWNNELEAAIDKFMEV